MANKKKKKANKQRSADFTAAPGQDESTQAVPGEDKSSKSEPASDAKKSKDKEKSKDKDKGKEVVKSQARAKDPKKANKKPNIFRRFIEYIKQVRLEIKRTTWPTKNEVLNMTIIVLVALLFFGVLIFVLDLIMVQLVNLYGQLAPDASTIDPGALTDGGTGDAATGDTGTGDTGDASGDSDTSNGGE